MNPFQKWFDLFSQLNGYKTQSKQKPASALIISLSLVSIIAFVFFYFYVTIYFLWCFFIPRH